jgi:hypothetical protein
MSFIKKLLNASISLDNLNEFIKNNSVDIYDFFISQKNSSINKHRVEIENFILPKYSVLRNLDFTNNKNQTFLFCLIDVSQRFGLATEFQQLFNLAIKNNVPLNNRLNAASLFLIGVSNINDFNLRINEIFSKLAVSYLKEEDNEQKTIATLIQFYAEVFNNFPHNKAGISSFKQKFIEELQKDEFIFLNTEIIKDVLDYSFDDINELNVVIHDILDEILERASEFLVYNIEPHLIETDTEYSLQINKISANFFEIRNLSNTLYSGVSSDEIFWSLQRGVKVLTEQNQLLAYLSSYGKMHQAKIISAIKIINENDLNNEIEIYDWGCGQGLASMCLLEYFNNKNYTYNLDKITLIEPSEIAIKRASLHVKKFNSDCQIITLNKDLDSLLDVDFDSDVNNIKIHLFSNILDIDLFSMNKLISIIKNNFKGNNIFICVSPFVSQLKTERIDGFVNSFSNLAKFDLKANISERNGEWQGTNWSRIVRVFSVEI